MSISSHYEVTRIEGIEGRLRFRFQSLGKNILLKAIDFEPMYMQLMGREVYNLGFGDNGRNEMEIIDSVVSDNGDVYRVFNTVLKTILVFFDEHPDAAIHVRGSDGTEDYFNKCILSCKKACITSCKREGRRMAVYRSFVNKYHDQLSADYHILGGADNNELQRIDWEYYLTGQFYNAILVYKKQIHPKHGNGKNHH